MWDEFDTMSAKTIYDFKWLATLHLGKLWKWKDVSGFGSDVIHYKLNGSTLVI